MQTLGSYLNIHNIYAKFNMMQSVLLWHVYYVYEKCMLNFIENKNISIDLKYQEIICSIFIFKRDEKSYIASKPHQGFMTNHSAACIERHFLTCVVFHYLLSLVLH